MRRNFTKLLSLIMTLCMLVGIMPMWLFVSAAETVIDAAIFCSDVHGSSTAVPNVFSQIASDGINPSVAGFVGDTNDSSSNQSASDVTTQAKNIFSGITCLYNYGSHDDEGGGGVEDVTGLLYGNETTNFYVYSISQSSMSSSSADTSGFTSVVASLDKSKPLFIMSHMPLHSRRGDNKGAAKWYTAISSAAESMDIVFFWAHNHTGESDVDRAAYYVAKNGSETMTIQGGSTVTPNFTYMNAGYIGKSAGRGGYATTIQITADSMIFQDYNSSGAVADNSYTHNVTVTREFAITEEPALPKTLSVTGTTEYTVGDALQNPSAITVTYDDGSTKSLSADDLSLTVTTTDGADLEDNKFTKAGTYNLAYSYTENGQSATATLVVTVKDSVNKVYTYDDFYGYYFEATGLGLESITSTYVYEEYEAVINELFYDGVAYEIALEGHTEGNEITYYFAFDDALTTENVGLYYIDENNNAVSVPYKLVTEESGIVYIQFTTTYVGVFAYGNVTVPEGYELSHITVDYSGKTKYLVGASLNMYDIVVNAVYTKEGADDFILQLSPYSTDDTYEHTWPDMTTSGVKTVTITYGGKSVSFDIAVYERHFSDANTGVSAEVTVPGATKIEATDVTATNSKLTASVGHLLNDYKAYDIDLTGYNDGEKVIVTLPVPEGVENPVVYYVSDDGKTVQNMGATKNDDGTVSFETDHFSIYVVGDSTEIEVPKPETATGSGETTTTETKTVYVQVSSISAAGDYLIVNTDSATTSAHLLTASSNSVTDTSGVTIVTGTDAGGNTVIYIESPAAATIWTASVNGSGYRLYNSSVNRYLQRNSSSLIVTNSSSSATSWKTTTNGIYYDGRYIRYNNGWTNLNNNSGTVYVYQKRDVNFSTTTTVSGTYSIEGTTSEITKVVVAGTTATLGSTLTFTPESGTATTTDTSATATYTVVENGDPNGIIKSITGNTVNFSGKYGKALVKVSYTGTAAGKSYTVDNYILITASAPYYELELHKNNDGVLGDEITDTIAIKGVTAGDTYSIWAVIKYFDGIVENGEDGEDIGDVDDDSIEWTSSDTTVATVDPATGIITFTGKDGTVNITAAYEYTTGKSVTDTVTFSVTASSYSVPSDGVSDFPEYPNEGSVRFDKTATAVGNFSETGIAQIELSMTGVPYTTGSEMDVVIMLDQSTSMDDNRIAATVVATKAFIKSIVINEDGTYNDNRIYVGYFNGSNTYDISDSANIGGDLASIDNETELDALFASIDDEFDGSPDTSGTQYGVALEKCYNRLNTAKTDGVGNDRQQFCVFMSDGVPTTYQYAEDAMHGSTSSTNEGYSDMKGMFTGTNYDTRSSSYVYEYYSTQMKKNGVTVYTVGLGLEAKNNAWSGASATQCLNAASLMLNDISGPGGETTQPDATGTSTLSKKDSYFFSVEDSTAATDMKDVFENIAQKILQAATDVTVEDKITDEYTMIFDIPEGSKEITGVTNDFYIEFVEYTLDENNERMDSDEDGNTYEEATSVTKLYLKNTNGTLSAASDSSGTAYAAPVFEKKTIGDKGTLYYWTTDSTYASEDAVSYAIDGTTYYFIPYGIDADDEAYDSTKWFNMTSGGYASGTVNSETNMSTDLVIVTPYFVYNADTKMLYWTVDKISSTEYALRYFLYLDRSATEVGTDKEVDADTYPTNEYAYLTYTNFNGNDCRQEFVKPQMTWNGAQVSYVFYLVNAAGQPINKSGQIVDFANATFITDVYTTSVVWNKGTDGQIVGDANLSVDWLANTLLPSDYLLYDVNAGYELMVYADATGTSIFNFFTIEGETAANISSSLNNRLELNTTSTTVSVGTTKVYNTKAGTKYSAYGTYTSKSTDSISNEIVLGDFDFSNSTVAFAVVWQPKLVEDTVVVDFGLDVVINVVENDTLQNTVSGIGIGNKVFTDNNIVMNKGVYNLGADTGKLGTADLTIDGNTISIENKNSVRFSQGDMLFDAPVTFYYESPVEFYEGSDMQEGFMYSSVTVIPATTIYFEESFVDFTNAKDVDENGALKTDENGDQVYVTSGNGAWNTIGTTSSKVQSQDRPGKSQISELLDADNLYGYDSAYDSCNEFSLGSAKKVTVNAATGKPATAPTATFTFTGTGFDIISLTDSDSGMIAVTVTNNATNKSMKMLVDNYYGYDYYEYYKKEYTYSEETQAWTYVITELDSKSELTSETAPEEPKDNDKYVVYGEGEWVVAVDQNADTIWQVPVIKVTEDDLKGIAADGATTTYGNYTVKIQVVYMNMADHLADGSYSFWLDAIRIYDPAKGNTTAEDAYGKDNEWNPQYMTLRDLLVSAGLGTDDKTTTDVKEGVVFIDGKSETASITDYANPGPNNETYLAYGQGVAFKLRASAIPQYVHLGVKLAYGSKDTGNKATLRLGAADFVTVSTATDMYYDLGKLEWTKATDANGNVYYESNEIVLSNATSGAVISITNIKYTFAKPDNDSDTGVAEASLMAVVDEEVLTSAPMMLMRMYAPVAVPDPFVPETFETSWIAGKAGKISVLTVTTSDDVASVTIDGNELAYVSLPIIKYENRKLSVTYVKVWMYTVKLGEGTHSYELVAYDADGLASEPVETAVTVVKNGRR